jgi:hypothetical protein
MSSDTLDYTWWATQKPLTNHEPPPHDRPCGGQRPQNSDDVRKDNAHPMSRNASHASEAKGTPDQTAFHFG